jgi:threonine dehydratase
MGAGSSYNPIPYPAMIEPLDVPGAWKRLRPHLPSSPLIRSERLSGGGRSVYLKCESLQPTGSFKVRGALNAVLSLPSDQLARGVVTASTGNHGRAVAHALSIVGAKGTVYVPSNAAPNKLEALRRTGVELVLFGEDSGLTEVEAHRVAEESGRPFISPYNDPRVIEGQGTIAAELFEQLPAVDTVYVAVGGGGLAAGVGYYLDQMRPSARTVGCWPENATALHASMEAGRAVDGVQRPTLSDATAGGVEPDAITIDLCRRYIKEDVFVSENEIADAIRFLLQTSNLVGEGASGVALAGFRQRANAEQGSNVVIVLSGGNIAPSALRKILDE